MRQFNNNSHYVLPFRDSLALLVDPLTKERFGVGSGFAFLQGVIPGRTSAVSTSCDRLKPLTAVPCDSLFRLCGLWDLGGKGLGNLLLLLSNVSLM